jgi:hypothetical protein
MGTSISWKLSAVSDQRSEDRNRQWPPAIDNHHLAVSDWRLAIDGGQGALEVGGWYPGVGGMRRAASIPHQAASISVVVAWSKELSANSCRPYAACLPPSVSR